MGKFFDLAIAPVALRTAFDRVCANGGGPGGDGMTTTFLAAHAPMLLARLHGELMDRAYRAGPLRRVPIPKKSGGTRTLSIPCVIDRVAQSAVAAALSAMIEPGFSPDSFAYRPGRGVKQAVARVAYLRREGFDHIVDGDIRGFFDAVPHAQLLAKVTKAVDDPSLNWLISHWLEGWDMDTAPGRGLAQGSPLSPFLANLYLDALDDLFADGPVRSVRFADDFLLLTKGQRQAEQALEKARVHLAAHGLELHPEKTKIVSFDQRLDFLGHLFVRSVVLEQEEMENLAVLEQAQRDLAARSLAPAAIPFIPAPRLPRLISDPANDMGLPWRIDGNLAITPSGLNKAPDDPFADMAALGRETDEFTIGLAPLYVLDCDATLSATGETFTVSRAGRDVLRVPATEIGRLEAGPKVTVEANAIRLAADYGLPLTLLDGYGRALATMVPPIDDRADLHLAQARFVLDTNLCLKIAGLLVEGKLRNQYALLKRLNRRRKLGAVETVCEQIKLNWHPGRAKTLDQLRGYEGEATKHYWRGLGLCLEHGFGLTQRREDGANPVNATLNWLSHLLTREMAAAVARAGLHPGFGMLHASHDRRDALAFDLVEPFRAPIAEGLMVNLINNRILRHDDFVEVSGVSRLTAAATREVLSAYEAWIARPVRNPRTGTDTTWRGLMLDEARAFAAGLRSASSSSSSSASASGRDAETVIADTPRAGRGRPDFPYAPYRMDW
jgi:CRISP-associated protein Cas1